MSKDKYPSIFLRQMKAYYYYNDNCVYYHSNLFRNTCGFENWGISSDILQF